MPILQLYHNTAISENASRMLTISFPEIVSSVMKKPIKDVMVIICKSDIVFGEIDEPAAFIDFRCINGLSNDIAESLCNKFAILLRDAAFIQPSRIYINFNVVCEEYAWRFVNGFAVCPKSNVKID
jgi:hypothetical protein